MEVTTVNQEVSALLIGVKRLVLQAKKWGILKEFTAGCMAYLVEEVNSEKGTFKSKEG